MIRIIYFMLLMIGCSVAHAQNIKVTGRKCTPEQGCGGDSTRFAVTGVEATSWQWTFGDASSGQNTSNKATPGHLYLQPGSYTITVSGALKAGGTYTKDTTIRVSDLPPTFEFFQGKEDTTICPGTKLLLDPYAGRTAPENVTYLWYPTGDTTRTIEVDSMGCYSVEVMNADSCTVTDRINVKICGQSEQQASKWYFGSNAGISFEGGQPSPISDGKINTPEGTSSISDRKGNLLFYTDGRTIFDKDGNPMKSRDPAIDTVKLAGGVSSTQAALIVPQPSCRGCETVYYVFTTKDIADSTKCLYYSRVDMRGNSGRGVILDKNILLQCDVTERLTSIQNPVDSSYWVLTHEYGSSKFILKRLAKSGLEDANSPEIGLPHDTKFRGEGQIKFATQGGKMGVVVPGPDRNYVEIYNFNDSTGAITDRITLDLGPAPPSAYGIEFSPDGSKVYVTLKGTADSSSVLLQYDLTSTDSTIISASKLEVAKSDKIFGALQYAPDGKIYMAIEGSEYLGVINMPDGADSTEIDFQLDGFNLGGKLSQLGLPNFVQSIIEPPTGPGISVADTCFGSPTQFSSGPICDPLKDKYEWDFGDGSPKSTQQQATHTYAAPGTYTVTLRQSNACKDTTMTQQVTIKPTPIAELGEDINQCVKSVTLDTKNTFPGSEYLWLRNGRIMNVPTTASKIQVDSSGQYVVLVVIGECFAGDTINVALETPPEFDLDQDTTFCSGNTVQLDAGPGGSSYLWSNGATTQQISVTESGTYSVTVDIPRNNRITCQVSDSVRVVVNPTPVVSVGGAETFCANATPIQLTGSPGNGRWTGTGVDSTGLFRPANPLVGNQTLTYTVRTAQGCSGSAQKVVTVAPYPVFSLGPDRTTCEDSLVVLAAPQGNGLTYRWSNGATTPSIEVRSSGTYRLVMSLAGCQNSDTVAVRVLPLPRVSVRPQASLCEESNQVIRIDGGGNNQPLTYLWSPNRETTRLIQVSRTGTYRVEVSTADGCREYHNVEVVNLCEPQIYVPDAFSPNGDGQNDRLNVVSLFISDQDYDLQIFDRWGELVFRTTDRREQWDGTYKGKVFPPQSYAWVVRYRSLYFPQRGIETKRGAVLIAR